MMKTLKAYIRVLIAPLDLFAMSVGWIVYLITKKTPGFAYQSMIRLFLCDQGLLERSSSFLIASGADITS